MSLSVIILTFNEELHIERCIKTLHALDARVIVVDSFSTDNTVKLAESLGAEVYQNVWVNYANQFQWALDHCAIGSEWVMRLDADEYLNNTLQKSLKEELSRADDSTTGYVCALRNVFLGRTIKYGGYDPLKLLRVWRFKYGRIESRWMDEHIVLSSGKVDSLNGELLHNNLNNHRWWTDKHNKYADREMIDIICKKYKLLELDEQIKETNNQSAKIKRYLKEYIYNRLPLFIRPTFYFLFRYLFCLGFLDGKEGYIYHYSQAYWYRNLVDIRVFEAERTLSGARDNADRIERLEKLTGLVLI